MSQGLRLMIYDDTCRGYRWPFGLTHSWIAGGLLYRTLGRLDRVKGVKSWAEAFDWIARESNESQIDEIQFWGHGKWGDARVNGEILDESILLQPSEHRPALELIRHRMHEDSLWWFRTCETFGADIGHSFACAWTDFFGCDAAGHTYIIGPWQSGLHRLKAGALPHWDPAEGIKSGSVYDPQSALWSKASAPNTISCLHGSVPEGF